MPSPHETQHLFRRGPRVGRLMTHLVVVATRRRSIPGVTPRRCVLQLVLALALVVASWAIPGSRPRTDADGLADRSPATAVEAAAAPMAAVDAREAPARPAARPRVGPAPASTLAAAPGLPDARRQAGRALLLTFDDGPDPRYTPQVLALLAQYDARAVFCVVGSEAQRYPELIRAIVGAGHDLCNHSTTHDMKLALRPGAAIRADLQATQAILRQITGGLVPRYMRTPGGRWSPAVVAEATALGLEPLSWSVDTRDWTKPGLRAIVGRVLAEAQPGGVVLMHDGGGDRSQSMLALPFLLRRLGQLGYDFR